MFTVKKSLLACFGIFILLLAIHGAHAAANPAAVYCKSQGNTYEIKTDAQGNEYGICISDGEEVDEWAFYAQDKDHARPVISGAANKDSKPAADFPMADGNRHSFDDSAGAPSTVLDWRDNSGNWVSPIKDQGGCGSCWAFGSVAVVESKAKIDLNTASYNIDLSGAGCSFLRQSNRE